MSSTDEAAVPDGAEPLTARIGPLRVAYDDRVLTPRRWTRAQAAWAAEVDDDVPSGPLLELCCGAGHIGLLAVLQTRRRAVLVDRSDVACRYAVSNAASAGVGDRVEVRCGPMESAVEAGERFSIVIADPPYIPSAETDGFPEDPLTAIDGGADGLDVARTCLAVASQHLAPGGAVLLQLRDAAQAARLSEHAGALRPAAARSVAGHGHLVLYTH